MVDERQDFEIPVEDNASCRCSSTVSYMETEELGNLARTDQYSKFSNQQYHIIIKKHNSN